MNAPWIRDVSDDERSKERVSVAALRSFGETFADLADDAILSGAWS